MKRRKSTDKYHKIEESKPICQICGEHTIEVETEDVKYRLDGEVFTLKEEFFRCHKDGDIYATPEMVEHNNSQLKAYMLKKEIEKGNNKVKIPSAVKEKLFDENK